MTLQKVGLTLALALALGVGSTALAGCELFLAPTKTDKGQLYRSGEGKYDSYFAAVHQHQVAAARWPGEAKASRAPIVTALDLRPSASNDVILTASRGKGGDASFGSIVAQTRATELDRARRLAAAAAKLEALERRGGELEKQAIEDRDNLGADKADEEKVAKRDEIKREVAAAIRAANSMASDARKGAEEAEDLAKKLEVAWRGKAGGGRPPVEAKPAKPKPAEEPAEVFRP